jgi:hypothetical protein
VGVFDGDFPVKNGDFPVRYVSLPEGKPHITRTYNWSLKGFGDGYNYDWLVVSNKNFIFHFIYGIILTSH